MAPQAKGVIPPDHEAAVLAAKAKITEAETAYHQAVADALNAGASLRELSKLLNVSTRTLQAWGKAHGWPDEALLEVWRRTRPADTIRADLREP